MARFQVQTNDIVGTARVGDHRKDEWIDNTASAGQRLLEGLKRLQEQWRGGEHIHCSFGEQIIGSYWNDFFGALIARTEAVLEKWNGGSSGDLAVDAAVKECIEKLEPLGLTTDQMASVQHQVERHFDN